MYENMSDEKLEKTSKALLEMITETPSENRQTLIDELKKVWNELVKRGLV